MNIVKFLLQRVVLLAVVVFGMVACGGSATAPGGGAASGVVTLSGTAATGKAIANTQITIKGANGVTVTISTDANGKYTRDVSALTPPYLLRVPDPLNANSYLFSAANASGTVNIHPFTDLIIRNWYKVKGADVETQFTGTLDTTKLPTVDGIRTIETVIKNILGTSFANAGIPADFNLMGGQFDADHTGFDQVLDQTRVAIAANGDVAIQAVDIVIDPITGASSGTGASAILAATTLTTLTTPAAVPDTAAPTVPGNPVASPASPTIIQLTWAASTDAAGVAGYNIYRASGINGTMALLDTSPFPAYSNAGLVASTQHCYQIEAFDLAGNVSATSAVVCTTTLAAPDTAAPAAPTSLVATTFSPSQINLTWVASTSGDTVAYDIYRGGILVATANGTGYSDTGLAANTLYSYTVKARDAAGNVSVASNSASATTAVGIPSAPAEVVAVAGNAQVTISWNPVSGATSYKMYMDTVSGISKTTATPGVMHHPSVTSPFVHTALTNGTTYFFVVTAVNASGESIESAQVQATPVAPVANVALAEVQAQLNVLNGLFATSLPAATDPTLAALFAQSFLDNGTDKTAFLTGITDPFASSLVGTTFTAQALIAPRDGGMVANDATHQWVSITHTGCFYYFGCGEISNWLAIKDAASGKWLIAGNQRKVGVFTDAGAFRNTFNDGTINMNSSMGFGFSSSAEGILATGVSSVTVSGPGMVNAVGNAGPATLFDAITTEPFMFVDECDINLFVTTNCFNYAGLGAGNYTFTFTVTGSLGGVPFTHTYVETVSMPPTTANLTAAMFPATNSTLSLVSLEPNAIVTATWILPAGYTTQGSFLHTFGNGNIPFLNVVGVDNVTGSSVTSSFTLPSVVSSITNASICVNSLSANGASFQACVGIAPVSTPTVTLTAVPSSIASGATSTLSWTSTNSTSCTSTGGGGTGTTGTFTTPALTATTTYTVTCTGAGGTASVSVTVTVGATPPPIPNGSTTIPSMPFNGAVVIGSDSFYTYTTVGNVGVINLTNLTDDVDVVVYTDASFTLPSSNWLCTANFNTVADSCTASTPVPSGTVLYIGAGNFTINGSATFTLNVATLP